MRRGTRLAINLGFSALVIAFCAAYASRLDWAKLSGLRIGPWSLALAVAAGVAYLFLATATWIRMLWRLNPGVKPSWELYAVYAKSWMGRYIPGKVAWVAGKIHFAASKGIPASQLGITSFLEAGVQMGTQLLISLCIVLADGHFSALPSGLRGLVLGAILGLLICLLPPVFNTAVALLLRLLKRESPHNIRVTWLALGEMAALYGAGYLLLGLSYFWTLRAIIPGLDPGLFAFTTAGISIAGTLGILALFAPSGLGVREGFIVVFLSLALPVELAVAAAAALRVSALLVDLAFLAACMAGRRLRAPRPAHKRS